MLSGKERPSIAAQRTLVGEQRTLDKGGGFDEVRAVLMGVPHIGTKQVQKKMQKIPPWLR